MRYQSPHGIIGQSFRPPRMGSKGAVVANHTLAAQAGIRTLHRGGNAVDAAISVAFALGVAEPSGSSIGGDGFVMTYMKDKKTIEVANGTGAAPAMATAERYSNGIPLTGILGTSVPGILDALLATHERHGLLPLASAWNQRSSCAKKEFPSPTSKRFHRCNVPFCVTRRLQLKCLRRTANG